MRFPKAPPEVKKPSEISDLWRLSPHILPTLPDGRYLHWSDLRWRPPPDGLSSEDWWIAQKLARRAGRVVLPLLQATDKTPFWFCRLDAIERAAHELDCGDVARELASALGDEATRQEHRIDQLIEEAISSSILEGAQLTTRAEAKAIIRDGRTPTGRGERMVVNNYNAMRQLLELGSRDLTLDDLLEIHAILGQDALDMPNGAGRLRRADENVRVEDATTGEIWFVPVAAEQLPELLEQLLKFANESDPKPFVHPMVHAIILHFWLAYLHPFVDGNGRLARALFYWKLLRAGYDFAQYLSISGPIDRSRRAYYLAFAHSETDDGDLTYFVLHQLAVLRRAEKDLVEHLKQRTAQLRQLTSEASGTEALNHRQQGALLYCARNPHLGVTVKGHASSHGVTYLTARKDLQRLEADGYLRRVRVGKTDKYLAVRRGEPGK